MKNQAIISKIKRHGMRHIPSLSPLTVYRAVTFRCCPPRHFAVDPNPPGITTPSLPIPPFNPPHLDVQLTFKLFFRHSLFLANHYYQNDPRPKKKQPFSYSASHVRDHLDKERRG